MSALDLGDIDWLAGPLDRASALTDALRASPDPGVRIWAPSSIERRLHDERSGEPAWRFPVLVAQTGTADELDRARLEERGVLVLVHPSGAAQVAPLSPIDGVPRWPFAFVDAKPDPRRTMAAVRVTHLDAAHRFAFPREANATAYTLFAVVADRVSNARTVTLSGASSGTTFDSKHVDRLAPAAIAPVRLSPPTVQSGAASNEPPTPAFVLRLDRYVARREGTPLTLRGGFRLPAPSSLGDGTVEVVLVATGAARPTPEAACVRVPARIEGDELVGSFVLDLTRTTLCERFDTFFVHAFTCGHAAVPAITTIVPDPG